MAKKKMGTNMSFIGQQDKKPAIQQDSNTADGKKKCTFRIDPELSRQFKIYAAKSGRTMSDIIEELLETLLK